MRNALCNRPGKCRLSMPASDGWGVRVDHVFSGIPKRAWTESMSPAHTASCATARYDSLPEAASHPVHSLAGHSHSLPALLMKRKASPAASLILRPDRSTMFTLLPGGWPDEAG